MKKKTFLEFLAILLLLALLGCAAARPPVADSPPLPLEKANLEAVLEEHEGLEITREDAKDLRDFYRGGVQHKARAEKKFQEKSFPDALKQYDSSNEFLLVVLENYNQDEVEFPIFEGASILFFPNLLVADNYLKMGRILREMGRESSAHRQWKRALPFIEKSLSSQRSEWGLSVRQELQSLLNSKGR